MAASVVAPVAFRNDATNDTSKTLDTTDILEGDVMCVLFYVSAGLGAGITPPAGWTEIEKGALALNVTHSYWVGKKVATGAAPVETFTTTNGLIAYGLAAFRGSDDASVSGIGKVNNAAANITAPNRPVSADASAFILCEIGFRVADDPGPHGASVPQPAFTNLADAHGSVSNIGLHSAVAKREDATGQADGTDAWARNQSSNEFLSFLFYGEEFSGPTDPPENTVAPVVTGTATIEQTLSCDTGTWDNVPDTFAYQWYKNGIAIGGATAATYDLDAVDVGDTIFCRVVATNVIGDSAPAQSNTKTVIDLSTVAGVQDAVSAAWTVSLIPAISHPQGGTYCPPVFQAERLTLGISVQRSATSGTELVNLCDQYDASL